MFRVNGGKFPVNMVHDNTHDENGDKHIEQDTGFHHERHGVHQKDTEDEYAVFKD